MIVLTFGVFGGAHRHPADTHHSSAPIAMQESAAHDTESGSALIHALFGHTYAGHAALHEAALLASFELGLSANASRLEWAFTQGERLPSQGAATLLRPPRA